MYAVEFWRWGRQLWVYQDWLGGISSTPYWVVMKDNMLHVSVSGGQKGGEPLLHYIFIFHCNDDQWYLHGDIYFKKTHIVYNSKCWWVFVFVFFLPWRNKWGLWSQTCLCSRLKPVVWPWFSFHICKVGAGLSTYITVCCELLKG